MEIGVWFASASLVFTKPLSESVCFQNGSLPHTTLKHKEYFRISRFYEDLEAPNLDKSFFFREKRLRKSKKQGLPPLSDLDSEFFLSLFTRLHTSILQLEKNTYLITYLVLVKISLAADEAHNAETYHRHRPQKWWGVPICSLERSSFGIEA